MEILDANKLLLFFIFIIPGFISMKVYRLLIASEKINVTESLIEAFAFSSINYALLSWLILIIFKFEIYLRYFSLFIVLVIFIIFIAPIIWTFLYVKIVRSKILRKFIQNPSSSPWDYFFAQQNSCWVIVNYKDGSKIGGTYSRKSYASYFPHKEQIYLQELWELNDENEFLNKIPRSNGILILGEDIKSIEFYT